MSGFVESSLRNTEPNFVAAELLDVQAVCQLLGGCSKRHVIRLSDAGRMPRPIKLGALLRWRRVDLDQWLRAGCPGRSQRENSKASKR